MQDKAQELQDTEEHREFAILEEPQDMGQQALKTYECVDALAMHQEASLELPATVEVALEESDPEALERHIPEQEYTLEAVEEPDILGLAHILGLVHISEPELRDFLDMEELDSLVPAHTSEPELQDSPALTSEPELRDSLELEYKLEQEEVELQDSGRRLELVDTSEPELQDNGSPQSHELGVLPP